MKRFLLTLLLAVLFCLSLFAGRTLAAPNPVPPPGRLPCLADQEDDPNFNASRPYQASPCGDAPKAYMCSNTLQIIETTPTLPAPLHTKSLDVNITMDRKSYIATLTGAYFPIVGNTELTKNSQSTADQIDDATKMDEYLNWYLTGAVDKAEYGSSDAQKTVDYSGPTKKLLPSIIQDSQRITTLNYLKTSQTYFLDETSPDAQESGDIPGPKTTDKAIIHNQIVVCTKKGIPFLPLWLTDFFGVGAAGMGSEIPIDCYPSAGSGTSGTVHYLNDWNGESPVINFINSAAQVLQTIYPLNIVAQFTANAATHWPKNYPPLPWADDKGKPFATDLDYQKAYNEWRGKLCTFLPSPNGRVLTCVGAWPLISNKFADLYKFVPISNTSDKQAKQMITGVGIKGEQGTELSFPDPAKKYKIIHEPILYFPHTAEVSEASSLLNKTYKPKTGTSNAPPSETTEPVNDPNSGLCRIIDLRTNPGDYLFPEVKPNLSEVNVDVASYTVTKIPCRDVTRTVTKRGPDGKPLIDPATGRPIEVTSTVTRCTGTIAIDIRMIGKIPYADAIYNSTTAGADSTFRKMFPKVQEGAPVSCVSNLPSVTGVQYLDKLNMKGMKVLNPLKENTTDNPQLYFPHFGSVYDLFLKGIQTALRPQGYGEPVVDGIACQSKATCGSWENKLKGSGGACGICNAPIGNLAKKILTAAGTAYNVPAADIWAAMKHEGADGYQGTVYDFSDANVRKWSNTIECGGEAMPGCNNLADETQPPFGFLKNWFYSDAGADSPWMSVQKIDPTRNIKNKVSRCNFLDAAFAAANLLSQGSTAAANGITTCGTYSGFDNTRPGTCSSSYWTDTHVAQSQTTYAGQCVEGPLYTLEEAVGWYHAASCQ